MPDLRVLTYNVHGCRGGDGRFDPARTAAVIAALAPDVAVLQELDVMRTRSGAAHQPELIARQLEMHFHFAASFDEGDGHYGNAVLSRFPLRVVRHLELPGFWMLPTERRTALWVEVDVAGTPVQVVGTHLGLLWPERLVQIEALLGPTGFASPECTTPRLLCGDLNSVPGSAPHRRLVRHLVDAPARTGLARATFPSVLPLLRLDHVLVSDDVVARSSHVSVTRAAREASDHLPLVVDLWIPDPPPFTRRAAADREGRSAAGSRRPARRAASGRSPGRRRATVDRGRCPTRRPRRRARSLRCR